ncbi:MAG: DEAD/DEAH box helicase [Acholeplasmatales bacterium]|nr:MAG: DEAD/DEAH box helicase [Acholeplasmatales bacterium]
MNFTQLNLHHTLLKTLIKQGYETPTPIQTEAIPHILNGRDVLGSAQTGTGKTAAFALPIIQQLILTAIPGKQRHPRALVLAPTRELALQIRDSFRTYATGSPIKTIAIFGGAPKRNQIQNLKRGVDVIVATPGRLLDLLDMGVMRLDKIAHYVLDEADRMLDMGFIPDVMKISSQLPSKRQTLLFSATLPDSIITLVKQLLDQPIRVKINSDNTTLDTINQSVYFLNKSDKPALLTELLKAEAVTSAIVFVRTKHSANRLSKALNAQGLNTDSIHGNKSQSQREKTLQAFKQNKTRILIATDVASRGLDIDDVTHIINYDMPETPDTYVHRIGRTARAGRSGHSLSFCSPEESHLLKSIQSHIGMRLPIEANHPFVMREKTVTKRPKQAQPSFSKRHTAKAKRPVETPFYHQTYKKGKASKHNGSSRKTAMHAS